MEFRFYVVDIRTRQGVQVKGLRIGATSAVAVVDKLKRMYPGCTLEWASFESTERQVLSPATMLAGAESSTKGLGSGVLPVPAPAPAASPAVLGFALV